MNRLSEPPEPLCQSKFSSFLSKDLLTKTFFRIAPRRHSEAVTNYGGPSSSSYQANYRNGHVPFSYSPIPNNQTVVKEIRNRFDDRDGHNAVYKKKPAPQPPRTPTSKYPAPQPQWEPRPRAEFSYEHKKVDPIKEMQLMAKISRQEEVWVIWYIL